MRSHDVSQDKKTLVFFNFSEQCIFSIKQVLFMPYTDTEKGNFSHSSVALNNRFCGESDQWQGEAPAFRYEIYLYSM
jgi:hypothetical protein